MKTKHSNFRTLMGSCLALLALGLTPVARSQSNASSQDQRPTALATMETRSSFATHLENQLRQRGSDARVQLDGDRRDVLHVEWHGVRRSEIYNFVSSSAAHDARKMGFTSFSFSNGSQRWDYDLSRESMIISPAKL